MELVTHLHFKPATEMPVADEQSEDFLLLNKCDGYHLARACFCGESFDSFKVEGVDDWVYPEDNFYVAWAVLPDVLKDLFPVFVDED